MCTVQIGKKKSLKVNQKDYDKLSEHIGFMPVVMITPNDNSLINEGNESRRKFFDSTISQVDRPYLHNLVRYQKALKQRNSLLKQFGQTMDIDETQLEPYNHELLTLGKKIFQSRSKFLKKFENQFDSS